jgi:hypothetical protein
MIGSHNDINVLQCSNMFSRLVEDHAPPVNFVINGHEYNKGYYLADGIYPKWARFVKTITGVVPGGKKSWFAKYQEACKKDVDEVYPRQCPCRRAFDLGSILGTWRTRRRSDESKEHGDLPRFSPLER